MEENIALEQNFAKNNSGISLAELILGVMFAVVADVFGLIPLVGRFISWLMGGGIWLWLFFRGQNFRKKYNPSAGMAIASGIKVIPFLGPLLSLYTVVVIRAYFKSKS